VSPAHEPLTGVATLYAPIVNRLLSDPAVASASSAEAMGNPGLLQETPDLKTLLPQGGGHREQHAAADGSGRHGRLKVCLRGPWQVC